MEFFGPFEGRWMRNLEQPIKPLSDSAGTLVSQVRRRLRALAANRYGIGARLMIGVLLFSGGITVILTAIQLCVEYRRDISAVESRFNGIGDSYVDSLAESLWSLDEKQLRVQLEGILRLPDIRVVEVREAGTAERPLFVRLSRDSGKSDLVRDYPLRHKAEGQDRVIGSFHVEATLAVVYRTLADTALAILVTQAAQTFLVSLFILYMFHYLVTRHLSAIAADVGKYRIEDSPLALRLRRPPVRREDELERLVTAFNALSKNLHITYRDLRDANERLAQDVMARRQAEAVLRDREARIRRLVDANIIGIFIWDMDGQILEANDAFLHMVGYDRDDLVGGRFRWTDLLPPEQIDQHARAIAEAVRTGAIQPSEREYCRKDGNRVPVLRGAAMFEEGGNQGVAFVLDLTERKRAEKAFRESEERFRTLMQFSFDVYWETDAQHRFIRQDFSERVTDGPLPGSELGKSRWELPYLDIDEEGWRKHREMLDAHLPFRDLEYARPTPDGGKRWAAVSGLPLFDEAGRFIGYRGVGRHITERKRIEEALRQREKELREIVETIPAMTVTIAADGRDVIIGKRFSEYSGLSEEGARGSGWKVTVHPDDLDVYLREWRASLASGDPVEFETRIRRADREYRWFLARAVPQRDEAGNVIRWYEVLTDIEDRKRAEAVLREREARIRRLVDANIIGIVIWNLDGQINDANDAFLRMIGYDREDLLAGRIRWTDLTPPELRERNEQTLEELNRGGTTQPFEKEYFRKDGSRVPVLIGRAIFEEGGNQGVAFVLDLTEQKQAEAALRESEEQWKAVFENNPVMYFMVDAAGTIVSVNPFGAEQLGYRVEELIGNPVQNVFHEADREAVQRNAAACFEQLGQAMSWELRKVRKNSEVIWVRETARATLINNRLVLLIVCEDITEGKRAAETLREIQMELAHANRVAALGQLTASIAHEVNQPITAAHTNANAALHFLDSKPPDLEEVREAVFGIVNDTDRAGDVIKRIRALVKKAPPRTESLDMNEAIRDVIVITRGEAAKNDISVEAQLTETLPLIRGDRVQLQQVILNLIINAIEAMTGVAGPRELLIRTAPSESDGVSVAVQDTGPGLAPAALNHAFEAFYTTKPDGLGIGLSICCSIVEAHGGKLAVTANVPHGTVFQFTLPRPFEFSLPAGKALSAVELHRAPNEHN